VNQLIGRGLGEFLTTAARDEPLTTATAGEEAAGGEEEVAPEEAAGGEVAVGEAGDDALVGADEAAANYNNQETTKDTELRDLFDSSDEEEYAVGGGTEVVWGKQLSRTSPHQGRRQPLKKRN
jgi:hypothetical protein